MYSRNEVVKLAESWVGLKESDGSYKKIIDIYNSYNGKLPRGIKMEYSWPWCACTWSALAIALGYTEIMPIEISCGLLIEEAKKMGCWQERDDYVPQPGDAVLYDWQDNGSGDNTGWPDHIGPVTYVNKDSGYMVTTEGNYSNSVKKRTVLINGIFIRGFITPKYDTDDRVIERHRTGLSVKEVAMEVIAGIWGNMPERKELLENYGYDYESVRTYVNDTLNGYTVEVDKFEEPTEDSELNEVIGQVVYATDRDDSLAGTYETTANLYLRIDAGTNKKAIVLMPKGTRVLNYGFYSMSGTVKWPLVQVITDGVLRSGFCCMNYLKKVK